MRQCFGSHFDAFALRVFLMGERHRDHIAACHIIDGRQQRARQNSIIWPHPTNQIGKDHPVNHSMRMIGDNNDRTFFWNALELFIRRQQVNAHNVQTGPPESLPTRCSRTFKLADQTNNGQLSRERFNDADKESFPRILKRGCIAQAASVILCKRNLFLSMRRSQILCAVHQLMLSLHLQPPIRVRLFRRIYLPPKPPKRQQVRPPEIR